MCPHKCPGLSDCYGDKFNELYIKYENENKGNRVVRARELWNAILTTQIETGTPYLFYKDQCNSKSNQKILELLNQVIFVQKLLNILIKMKLLYVI